MSEPLLSVRLDGDRVMVRARDGLCYRLTPEQATVLANQLTDAVDHLDGREQCGWHSASADDAYCRCVKPAGHYGVHECAHSLDHNATNR